MREMRLSVKVIFSLLIIPGILFAFNHYQESPPVAHSCVSNGDCGEDHANYVSCGGCQNHECCVSPGQCNTTTNTCESAGSYSCRSNNCGGNNNSCSCTRTCEKVGAPVLQSISPSAVSPTSFVEGDSFQVDIGAFLRYTDGTSCNNDTCPLAEATERSDYINKLIIDGRYWTSICAERVLSHQPATDPNSGLSVLHPNVIYHLPVDPNTGRSTCTITHLPSEAEQIALNNTVIPNERYPIVDWRTGQSRQIIAQTLYWGNTMAQNNVPAAEAQACHHNESAAAYFNLPPSTPPSCSAMTFNGEPVVSDGTTYTTDANGDITFTFTASETDGHGPVERVSICYAPRGQSNAFYSTWSQNGPRAFHCLRQQYPNEGLPDRSGNPDSLVFTYRNNYANLAHTYLNSHARPNIQGGTLKDLGFVFVVNVVDNLHTDTFCSSNPGLAANRGLPVGSAPIYPTGSDLSGQTTCNYNNSCYFEVYNNSPSFVSTPNTGITYYGVEGVNPDNTQCNASTTLLPAVYEAEFSDPDGSGDLDILELDIASSDLIPASNVVSNTDSFQAKLRFTLQPQSSNGGGPRFWLINNNGSTTVTRSTAASAPIQTTYNGVSVDLYRLNVDVTNDSGQYPITLAGGNNNDNSTFVAIERGGNRAWVTYRVEFLDQGGQRWDSNESYKQIWYVRDKAGNDMRNFTNPAYSQSAAVTPGSVGTTTFRDITEPGRVGEDRTANAGEQLLAVRYNHETSYHMLGDTIIDFTYPVLTINPIQYITATQFDIPWVANDNKGLVDVTIDVENTNSGGDFLPITNLSLEPYDIPISLPNIADPYDLGSSHVNSGQPYFAHPLFYPRLTTYGRTERVDVGDNIEANLRFEFIARDTAGNCTTRYVTQELFESWITTKGGLSYSEGGTSIR